MSGLNVPFDNGDGTFPPTVTGEYVVSGCDPRLNGMPTSHASAGQAAESTPAALRRVEQERDELRAEAERLIDVGSKAMRERTEAQIERDEMRAERDRARAELDAVRTARDNLERELHAAVLAHIHCPDRTEEP